MDSDTGKCLMNKGHNKELNKKSKMKLNNV